MFLEILLSFFICILVIKLFVVSSKPAGTPPGTIGLPIIGSIPSHNTSFDSFINEKRLKYGDIIWLKIGERKCIILCNYDDITLAFNNPALQGRPSMLITDLLYKYGEKDVQLRDKPMPHILGLLGGVGESWKNLRRFVIRRLRDGGMGKSSMEDLILREAEALVEDFEKHVGTPTEIPWSVNASIFNAVWEIVGERRSEVNDKDTQLLCNYLNDVLEYSQSQLFLFNTMGWLIHITPKFILNRLGVKKFENKMEQVYKILHKAVDEHQKTLDVDNPRDLIDYYLIDLNSQENGSSNNSGNSNTFCERELVQSLFDLFIAGSETTSSTIKWFLLFMAKYPVIQKKVQEEIDSVVSKDKMISLKDKDRLPYFESCINETLRLKPILPFGVFHTCTENTMLGKYFVPEKTLILSNIIACHKEAKYWKKPNDYYPEHFLNEHGTFNGQKEGFIPFSIGKRVCLGENLARMDLFLILGTLMQKFTFSQPEGETLSGDVRADQPFFTLPKPFKIVITKRS